MWIVCSVAKRELSLSRWNGVNGVNAKTVCPNKGRGREESSLKLVAGKPTGVDAQGDESARCIYLRGECRCEDHPSCWPGLQ